MDYQVALEGFAEGIKHFNEVRIDKRAVYFKKSMWDIESGPKIEIELSEWDADRIETMIDKWVEPPEYSAKFPGGMLASSGSSIFSRALALYRWHKASGSMSASVKQVVAWLLIGAGRKLRNLGAG
jgi:hypothetical protein